MIIRLKVFEQTLSIVDTKSIPRKGSKDYLILQFTFSSDWKDLNKVCYLQHGDVSQPIDVVDGLVEVPEWFTEQDSFDVTLFGKSGTQEVPTNVVSLRLEKSNTLWEKAAPEPQPSWLAKVIDLNNHPPIPGDNGYWLIWDTDSGAYVESELPQSDIHPDWNQNDETAPDYIKNKPFYTGDPVETVLVEESTVPFTDIGGLFTSSIKSTFSPTVGNAYKISWDGTDYESTCVKVGQSTYIGNLSIDGSGPDTGEPFLMSVTNQEIDVATLVSASYHTISISRFVPGVVVKIDPKYLPDNPLNITGATVGQIAKITAVDASGKPTAWEAADLPNNEKFIVTFSGNDSPYVCDKTMNEIIDAYENGQDISARFTGISESGIQYTGLILSLTTYTPYEYIEFKSDIGIYKLHRIVAYIDGTGACGVFEETALDNSLTDNSKAANAKAVGDSLAMKQDTLIQSGATVGQIAKITAVDDAGKPTAWEAADIPSGDADGSGVTEYHASNNLYDAANLVGTHTINGSTVSGLSNWIPVKAKTKYASDAHHTQYYFFDAEKNYLSGATYITSPVVVTAPQDGFLLIKTNGNTETIVVEGTDLGNHYGGYYALKESLTKRVSKVDNNTWKGKKWLAIGDSLTDPAVASEGYPYLVSKALGLTLTNVGASGKVMNYFVDLIPDYADDFDLVTVLLGSNNQGYNCAIGSLNDGVDYTTNNSFYAQTQKMAEVLMAKYPTAVIAFITPIRRTGVGEQNNNADGYMINALSLTTEPYAEAVKEVADYYGLPCLDLYHNGINPKSEWMRQLYFVNSDGTHPNNDGHAKYTAPVIKAFLETLAPFGEKTVTYSVTNNLTNAENSNAATSVFEGSAYSANITATSGYVLSSVTVSMGGTDISASAVSGGTITIASVTGNIVITATATEVGSGEPVLVHSYIGASVPESGVLKDQTGSFDLIKNSNSRFFSNYGAENGSAFALSTGDSASFKFVNVSRNTLYYTESCNMDTSGVAGWNIGISGNPDTSGRIQISPYGTPEGATNTTFGDACPQLSYRPDDGNEATILYSSYVVTKGETHTIAVTVNAADKSIKMYVDGTLAIDEVMTTEPQFDGLTVAMYNNCPFDRLEVYRGIITDVT